MLFKTLLHNKVLSKLNPKDGNLFLSVIAITCPHQKEENIREKKQKPVPFSDDIFHHSSDCHQSSFRILFSVCWATGPRPSPCCCCHLDAQPLVGVGTFISIWTILRKSFPDFFHFIDATFNMEMKKELEQSKQISPSYVPWQETNRIQFRLIVRPPPLHNFNFPQRRQRFFQGSAKSFSCLLFWNKVSLKNYIEIFSVQAHRPSNFTQTSLNPKSRTPCWLFSPKFTPTKIFHAFIAVISFCHAPQCASYFGTEHSPPLGRLFLAQTS